MRIMGLDYGERRIGIAISDPLGWTAQPHSTLVRSNEQADMNYLKDLCVKYQIERIVIGLPLNMNGSLGPKALEVQAFGDHLAAELKIPVEYSDERLSTVSAEKALLQADVSRRKRKKVIDKLAAVTILQSYLDKQVQG